MSAAIQFIVGALVVAAICLAAHYLGQIRDEVREIRKALERRR